MLRFYSLVGGPKRKRKLRMMLPEHSARSADQAVLFCPGPSWVQSCMGIHSFSDKPEWLITLNLVLPSYSL